MKVSKLRRVDYCMLVQNSEFSDELVPVLLKGDAADCVYLDTGTEKIWGGLVTEDAGEQVEMKYVKMYYCQLKLFVNDYFLKPRDDDKALYNMMQGVLRDYPRMSLGFWLRLIQDFDKKDVHYLIACLSIFLPGREVGEVIYPHKIGSIEAKTRRVRSNRSTHMNLVDMFESIMVRVRIKREENKML